MASSQKLLYDCWASGPVAKISDRRRFAMALSLVTAIAREPARRAVAGAMVLLLVAAMQISHAWAQDTDGAYSAIVKVDATADSAAAAREAARVDGQRRALAAVIERLSGSPETSKPPKLDDKTITGMVDSFEVANERMSGVRYVADLTFHFRPSRVRRFVRVVDSAGAEGGSKSPIENGARASAESAKGSIVVLPVYKDGQAPALWDDPNDWRAAWAQRPANSASDRLTLPLGDAGDLTAIDAERAASGKAEALASIAQRNGASEAAVALATARRQDGKLVGLDVAVKRYRAGRLVDTQASSYDANSDESEADLLRRVANAVAAEIENAAKKSPGARSDQEANLVVTVPITSLGEWLQVRNRLAAVAAIRKVDLLSLSRQEAKIEVKYVGSQDQLKSSLAEVSLDLAGGDPVWRIQPAAASSSR
jgi:Uncharacterized protein conserved in bacteria (DUF2066)